MAKKTKARTVKRAKPAGKDRATAPTAPASQPSGGADAAGGSVAGLRVRMFRVGFGDFFLLTVPAAAGDKHILIDCGVHAKDLGTMHDAVSQMAQACNSQLALIIVTHRHADHISGFGTCKDIFSKINVERVWMSWFEDPKNPDAKEFQSSLTAMAAQVRTSLAARGASPDDPLVSMAENITGTMSAAGQAGNQAALAVIHGGFANTPEYNYYKAGDTPTLPPDLVTAGLSAQILGPPIDPKLVSQMTNKNQQYLAAGSSSDDNKFLPFAPQFKGAVGDYPKEAFQYQDFNEVSKLIDGIQPDTLAAKAAAADNTLNNQSVVVLFSFRGKNSAFRRRRAVGQLGELPVWRRLWNARAHQTHRRGPDLLGKIDFYKVGHHGSANATPMDAVAAMKLGCVGMCSTQPGAYNQVPRAPLLSALGQRMNGQLARSDQIFAVKGGAGDKAPTADAGPLPTKFTDPTGVLYVDYEF